MNRPKKYTLSRFYDNCKKKISGKKEFSELKRHSRSVESKTSGWK
jgi:putative transposase